MRPIDTQTLERLAQKISPGSRLLRSWPLAGGISARMTAFEIERPGGRRQRLIVRQPAEWTLQQNPAAAAEEFRLLQVLSAEGLPVPTPVHLDESGEILPSPYLVIEYVEGEPMIASADPADLVREMAAQLAAIHALSGSRADLSFLPRQAETVHHAMTVPPADLDDSLDAGRIRETLEPVWPLPPANEPVLLHGDFWPGNLLWREGRIAGVIDWEEAKIGDPLYDVAICRLDILWAYGIDAMHEFTACYQAIAAVDWANMPYWDLFAALRPVFNIGEWAEAWSALGRTDITEAMMRDGHQRFVAQAFEKLSSGAV